MIYLIPGKLFIMNGKDIGKTTSIVDGDVSVGFDLGVFAVLTSYYFVGDVNNMSLEGFKGTRLSASAGFSIILELG